MADLSNPYLLTPTCHNPNLLTLTSSPQPANPQGSIERFFGVLIESTAGDFPLWLAPTQLRLLPVSDDFLPYCAEVKAMANKVGHSK